MLERPTAAMLGDPRLMPAKRPAPQPPVSMRPDRLSLTNIARLIRDPYAIYARHILRLYPLDPLHATPTTRERGKIVHSVLEEFVKTRPAQETRVKARQRLLDIAVAVLNTETAFPSARALWLARLDRAADHFLTQDAKQDGIALVVETKGSVDVSHSDSRTLVHHASAAGFTEFIPETVSMVVGRISRTGQNRSVPRRKDDAY